MLKSPRPRATQKPFFCLERLACEPLLREGGVFVAQKAPQKHHPLSRSERRRREYAVERRLLKSLGPLHHKNTHSKHSRRILRIHPPLNLHHLPNLQITKTRRTIRRSILRTDINIDSNSLIALGQRNDK